MKKAVKIIVCFLLGYIILERVPIQKCISMETAYERLISDNTYICEFEATTGADWSIQLKNEDSSRLVCLEGNVPTDRLNKASFFWFAGNRFLIQGEIVGMRIVSGEGDIKDYYDIEKGNKTVQAMETKYECYDIINVIEWDIIAPIERGNSFRFLAPKDFLNLFDFI